MDQDELSSRGGYSIKSYLKSLEKGLISFYKPGKIFQQDNTRIHVSKEVQEWFKSHGI